LTLILAASVTASNTNVALPAWISKRIADRQNSYDAIHLVEEVTYEGKQAFELYQGIPDAPNEHMLFNADERLICLFGGIAGVVTSGKCDIGKINFVRTLWPPLHNLHVLADGKIRIDDGPEFNFQELPRELQKLRPSMPTGELHLVPERKAKYDFTARVLAELQKYGVRVGFKGVEQGK